MKCPSCGAENEADRTVCSRCGLALGTGPSQAQQAAVQSGSSAVFAFGRKAREARMAEVVDPDAILDTRVYNAVMIGVLLWGLLVNVLLCQYAADFVINLNPVVFLVGYFVLAIGGVFVAHRSTNPAVSFLGYNMVVIPFGLVISMLVRAYAEIDPVIVRDAFLYTLLISLGMMSLVMIRPQFFEKLGGVLIGGLIGLVLCEIILLIFRVDQAVTCWIAAALFSLYIGYDIYRSQNYPKTLDNAVDSALDIYMDMANLFIRLLQILGNSRRRD